MRRAASRSSSVGRTDPTPEQAELLRIEAHSPLFREDLLCEERGTGRRPALRHLLPFSTIADTRWRTSATCVRRSSTRALASLGHELRWNEPVRSRLPLPDEADALRIKPGIPLLLSSRVTLAADGRPLAPHRGAFACRQRRVVVRDRRGRVRQAQAQPPELTSRPA